MGARGAQPRADAVRQTSKDVGLTWIDLPPEGNSAPVPSIPYPANKQDSFTEYGKQMWITLWQSPESTQWNRTTDIYNVYRYIALHEEAALWQWTGASMTAALSLAEKLGMTPYAKRRMYWRIKPQEDQGTMPHLASVQTIKGEELR